MSNTESAQTQWKQIAGQLGFADETAMWYNLYLLENRSIGELAKTLGFGTATVARRIGICGVEKRNRGGAQNPSKILISITHLDQRFVRLAQPQEIADLVGASVHSVYRILKEI
jgi:hypothetical protein